MADASIVRIVHVCALRPAWPLSQLVCAGNLMTVRMIECALCGWGYGMGLLRQQPFSWAPSSTLTTTQYIQCTYIHHCCCTTHITSVLPLALLHFLCPIVICANIWISIASQCPPEHRPAAFTNAAPTARLPNRIYHVMYPRPMCTAQTSSFRDCAQHNRLHNTPRTVLVATN